MYVHVFACKTGLKYAQTQGQDNMTFVVIYIDLVLSFII